MGLFKFLPKVKRFCWCTRSLKCASFMVIILGMFTGINTVGLLCKPACTDLYEVSSPVKLAVNILRWLLFSSEMLLLASTFGFLLGIFYSVPVSGDILICTALLKCLVSIVYAVLMLIQEQYTQCRWYYSQIFHLILFIISINTVGLLCKPACTDLYEVSSPVKLAVNILRWLLFSSEMLLLASTFGFLLGIFYSVPVSGDVSICTAILKCLTSIYWWRYFIIVVNSYGEEVSLRRGRLLL